MKPNYIFVIGAFSSGTTAVTGILMRLGSIFMDPLSKTNDPRTPSSLESVAFQKLCDDLVSEENLRLHEGKRTQIIPMLLGFKHRLEKDFERNQFFGHRTIVLKRATAAFFLKELELVFRPRFVFVYRELDAIENTKKRRKWPEAYGQWGAEIVYREMRRFSANSSSSPIIIHFEELSRDPQGVVVMLNRELEFNASQSMQEAAFDWIIQHKDKFGHA